MRWFWIVLVVLVVGAGVMLARMGSAPTVAPSSQQNPNPSQSIDEPPTKLASEGVATDTPSSSVEAAQPEEQETATEFVSGPRVSHDVPMPSAAEIESDPVEEAETVADGGPAEEIDILDLLLGIASDDTAESDEESEGGANTGESSAAAPRDPKGPAVVEREDGSFLIDQRFVVYGRGTEASPFRIPWDLLVAAQETYRPRLKKTELPEWANLFSGMHVQISGYLTLPTIAGETEELLVMRNEWDGCCIGVPPTPYDSIEVKLLSPARLSRHMINFGTISGRFVVNPYLWKDWLISLYVIEEAKVNLTGI